MFSLPEIFYDVNIFSVAFRLLLALLIGGIIGIERGVNRHAAGFRTHILVCMGAALAMLTNQYIFQVLNASSDPARIGAQVITGVGFLGVGTILVTGHNRIKGLTTAAGLWASACLGLAIGIGFYEGAIICAILIFMSLAFLPKLERYFYFHSGIVNLYVEVENLNAYKEFMKMIKSYHISINEVDLTNPETITKEGISFVISFKIFKKENREMMIEKIGQIEGVIIIEEV